MKKILFIFMGFILCIFAQEDTLKTSISLIKLDNHTLEANVTFHNVSNEPLRIYFIENPIFNTFQSMLYVTYSDGNIELFSEEPHPNGISVEESDFHLIDVNKSKTFTQKIEFIESRYQVKPIELQWVYKNKITKYFDPVIKSFNELLNVFYFQLGVDGVFTDFPDLVIQFLKNISQ